MATTLAHAQRVPHTVKPPAHCPHCGSTRLIRKGTRRKKLEIVQLWQCKLCRRVFTPAPAELRYKTYPLRIILDGVTLYNLGYQTFLNGTLVSTIVIDTSEVATDTIDYVATDNDGLTATSTRTVIIEGIAATTTATSTQ